MFYSNRFSCLYVLCCFGGFGVSFWGVFLLILLMAIVSFSCWVCHFPNGSFSSSPKIHFRWSGSRVKCFCATSGDMVSVLGRRTWGFARCAISSRCRLTMFRMTRGGSGMRYRARLSLFRSGKLFELSTIRHAS